MCLSQKFLNYIELVLHHISADTSRFQKILAPKINELIGEHIVGGFKVNEYVDDSTQTIKRYGGKVSVVREKKWVEREDEDEANCW